MENALVAVCVMLLFVTYISVPALLNLLVFLHQFYLYYSLGWSWYLKMGDVRAHLFR